MATHEVDLIRDAIASTEKEIFGEAWGQEAPEHDDTGDRSIEQMGEGLEGQHEPPEDEEEADADSGDEEEAAEGEDDAADDDGEPDDAEEPSDSDEEAEETEASEPPEAKPPEAKPEDRPQGRVPAGRLREQTERAERAEAALRAMQDAQRSEIDGLKRQFDGLVTALQHGRQGAPLGGPQGAPQGMPQGAPQPPDRPPDVFENPQGYTDYLIQRQDRANAETRQLMATVRFQTAMDIARGMHGDKFTKAWDAVNKLDARNPEDLSVAQRIFNAADPGGELLRWHARTETLRVVGDDPDKYRQTITNEVREAMRSDPEFRKQFLDDLRAEAAGEQPSKPARHITRLPKSLNGATGQGTIREKADPDLYDNSEQSVFNSAWR
jgi:hypothetical protein